MEIIKNEPVLAGAIITPLVIAAIQLAKAFGVPLTLEQEAAILTFVGVVVPLLGGWLGRRRVTPVWKVAKQAETSQE